MKRKSFFAILAIATMLILSLTVLTGCNGKKHDFSGEWLSDDTNHWHACTTKKHTDVADAAEHTFDAGVVTTAPTETAEGVLTLTCTVCKHQKTKVLAKVAHVHKFNESVWEKDDTHHWHPATCAHTDQKSVFENHVWNEGVITTPATETTEGEKTYTCTKCGQTKTSSIGKLDHVHTFDTENWAFDTENHWHPATCGHADEKNALAPHTWNEGVITTPATETTDGEKTYTCTKCGNTKTSSIGKLDHVHTFDTENWAFDAENHWHPATCGHADEKNASAPHEWNDGVITKPSDYGVAGEKTYTCNVCRTTKTEAIKALDAKDNVISFADGVELSKTYDGTPVVLNPENVRFNGNGALTIEYKLDDESDSTYTTTAPTDAGEYTVKASVAATAEWKGGEITTSFIIEKRAVTLSAGIIERKLGENLESGKFGLECVNVAEDTNNVVEWVTICVPEKYYAVGMYTIATAVLTVDNDNFELDKGSYDAVRFTVRNVPDSFYAGIQDLFTLSGTGEVIIRTKIANGAIKAGDQILVNEIGKIITVKKIEKGIGTSATIVDTANVGDEVGFSIEGATRSELERGYMLSEPDTIIGYSKVTVTIRAYTKDEGNHAPIATGNKMVAFADTFGEVTGKVTLPEGADLLTPGEMLENVTVNFQGEKIPAFVGRRFTLKSSARTVAECIITAVPQATSVNCAVSEPTGKTAVIAPIESGEKTFAFNLNRSSAIEDLVDSEAIDVVVKYNDVIVGSYKRTGLGVGEGDLAHVENGGALQGSYININLAKGVAGLTDADGNWICDQANVTLDVSATLTQQLDNLGEGSVGTVSLGKNEVKYFTLNELENLPSGWYSFVDAIENSGVSRYRVYTSEGEKVPLMSDTFKSNGGKYYVKYSSTMVLAEASVGFKAAKQELTATNITTGLQLPAGKTGDRVVIKVTVKRAVTYFHTNYVRFTQKLGAFNGRTVKVFYADYSQFDGIEYTTLSTGDRFKIPNRNNQEIYVYILMEYAADVAANTAELKFINSTSADSLPVVTTSGGELKSVNFTAKEFKNFYFNVSTPGKYRVEIVQSDSTGIVPFDTIGIDKLYDFNFNPVTVIGSRDFNVTETGNYSITLKNHTNSEQKVRIHVVKVS